MFPAFQRISIVLPVGCYVGTSLRLAPTSPCYTAGSVMSRCNAAVVQMVACIWFSCPVLLRWLEPNFNFYFHTPTSVHGLSQSKLIFLIMVYSARSYNNFFFFKISCFLIFFFKKCYIMTSKNQTRVFSTDLKRFKIVCFIIQYRNWNKILYNTQTTHLRQRRI